MYTSTQRLMRSRTEKVIAGVAGGLASYFSIDPVLARLVFIALLFTGVGALLYPILWLIMPLEGNQAAPHKQAFDEMRAQAEHVGDHVRTVFVSQPADESEIPIQDLGGNQTPKPAATDRSRQIGILLLGFGALALGSLILGPAFGRMIFPLLLVGAGFLILRRTQ